MMGVGVGSTCGASLRAPAQLWLIAIRYVIATIGQLALSAVCPAIAI
jgi:hypothetical protein